jgi:hypothetical protein
MPQGHSIKAPLSADGTRGPLVIHLPLSLEGTRASLAIQLPLSADGRRDPPAIQLPLPAASRRGGAAGLSGGPTGEGLALAAVISASLLSGGGKVQAMG